MTAPAAVPDSFAFPASLAQQRLWFLADSDPTGVAYNVARAVLIRGALDVDALRGALALVVERHEALRTCFDRVDGRLVQVVSTAAAADVAVEDAGDVPDADLEAAVRRLARNEARRPFDLRHGPLVRFRLYRLGEDRFLLCLTLHHIICDAWSLALLYREVTRAYGALAGGQAPALGPVPLQYADFAVWEQEHEHDARRAEAIAFWREELAGLPATLDWPADFPRPAAPTWQGEQVAARLPDTALTAVRRLAQEERTTPAVVLLAAFAAFLHRWTGDTDIPVGMPLAGRDRVELEPVVGCFVNTAITRFRLEGPMSFRRLVQAGRALMLDALRHQAASFDAVVQVVRPSAARGSSPLFHALFTLHSLSDDRERIGSLDCTAVPAPTGTAKCDVTMVAVESRDSLRVSFEFNRDLFDPRTMAAAADGFRRLAAAALESPDTTIADLPLAPAGGALALRGPQPPYPRDTGVHTLFARMARASASAVAIDAGAEQITYAELQRRAGAITAALQDAGVAPGQFVGLLADRGPALVAGMIGILGAGAAYVPIDPADPPARVAAIVLDAGVRVLLTAADGPPLQDVRTLSVDGRAIDVLAIDGLLQSSRESAAATDADGGTPAYVIYTSGSTGNPKGVVVPHRAIARLVLETDYVQIEPADRVALASNVAFDAATFEIWGALLNGATLVVVSPEVATSPALLAREIRQRRLSVLFVTTAVFNRVAADDPGGFGPLRALLFGGEASSPRAVAAVLAAGTPTALVHVYGPTECTTFATAHRVTGLDPRAATVPIGLPIAHTTACIMDDRGTPAAHGVAGELWLGGDGVAIGYHGLAGPTAERFVTHEGVRMYRTGDRCRVNADGVIEFVARMDRQLKIRGFRIEPAEVERTLAGHEAVAGVVVDAVGEGDEHRLVACVTAPPGTRVDAAGLVRYLGERLPRFAIPAISIVAELPLTANGKIDRRRLAGLVTAASEGRQFAAPRDPLEEELARLWEELLQVSPIGITDDFFLLGGHSLLGAAMMDRVEKQFGRRVPISALLQHPTIEGLAGTLWEAERSSAGPLTVLREAGTRPPLFFLHGDLNGAGLYCARLARMLDASQPVYSLAPLGLDGRSSPPSIEGMAAEYVAIIRACRPEGPIAIGGYCHGASIAFEIARRLAGERQVTSVLMVYPPAVEPRLAPVDAAIRAACRLLGRDERRRVALTLRVGDALRVLAQSRGRGAGRFLAAKLTRAFSSASPSRRRPAGAAATAGAPGERHDPRTWARYIRAVAAYVPRRYEGRVRLFMPEIRTDNETRGWHHAAPRAVVCGIAGDHRGCITTHLDSLARALDRELAGVAHDPGGAPLPPAALATARDHHELT